MPFDALKTITKDALDRFLEASNPLVSLMLDEVARILRAYKELRDSRLNDVLEVRPGCLLLLPLKERPFRPSRPLVHNRKTFPICVCLFFGWLRRLPKFQRQRAFPSRLHVF